MSLDQAIALAKKHERSANSITPQVSLDQAIALAKKHERSANSITPQVSLGFFAPTPEKRDLQF